ncbi:MAG: hypothetical protein HRT47_09005 [Candidatus Caenarcaniphilales bacterium]|nr:hypothetical protein [Candidatus Caenarcaniphilales bacterium]
MQDINLIRLTPERALDIRQTISKRDSEIKEGLKTLNDIQSLTNIFQTINEHLDDLIELKNSTTDNVEIDSTNNNFVNQYSKSLFWALNEKSTTKEIFKNFPAEIKTINKREYYEVAKKLDQIEQKYQQVKVDNDQNQFIFQSYLNKQKSVVEEKQVFYTLNNKLGLQENNSLIFNYPLNSVLTHEYQSNNNDGKAQIFPLAYYGEIYEPPYASFIPDLDSVARGGNLTYTFKEALSPKDLLLFRNDSSWIDNHKEYIEKAHLGTFLYQKRINPSIEGFFRLCQN